MWEDDIKMDLTGTEQTAWTEIIWLWTGISGRLLWTWQCTPKFHKKQQNSQQDKQPSVSHRGSLSWSSLIKELLFLFSFFLLRFSFSFRNSPQWAMASSFMRFLYHTRRTIVSRTPQDKWSARHRDLYLATCNTHDRYPRPWWDSNPQSQHASSRRPTP